MAPSVRDFSIWNMLKYGSPRVPQPVVVNNPESGDSYHFYDDEKYALAHGTEKMNVHAKPIVRRERRSVLQYLVFCGIIVYGIIFVGSNLSLFSCNHHGSMNGPKLTLANYDTGNGDFVQLTDGKPREIIGVGFPYTPPKSYGDSLLHVTLVNQTFGQSWGKPAIVQFKAPDFKFNKVVLTLKTEVDNVQYDRLINIFVNGVQIWRTSTIEPGGNLVSSTALKDVSTYLNLFKKDGVVMFQLDNLLNKRLTGEFKITLCANFYNTEEEYDDGFSSSDLNDSIFTTAKPADRIYPLVVDDDELHPPLAYLPSDKINVQLPAVSVNTTRLRLSIFTSGNAQEEFWYGNVIDKFKNKYASHGRPLPGHGPVRIVNVYFNGEKIATQSPEPVVFTGGISPALWSSVVSNNAFDVPAIDVDLTGLLPVLWESQNTEERYLEIEISNGLGETGKSTKEIGENWITTANLLTYENEAVESVQGELLNIDLDKKSNVIAISAPYTDSIQQIITTNFNATIESNLGFTLKGGLTVESTIISKTSALVQNVQSYSNRGAVQRLVHNGQSLKSFTVEQNDQVAHLFISAVDYPFVLSLVETEKSVNTTDFQIHYDVQLVCGRSLSLHSKDDGVHVKNSAYQNGSSQYVLSSLGNYGFGELDTNYTISVEKDHKPVQSYNRYVKAANKTILSDDSTENNFDKEDNKGSSYGNQFAFFNDVKYLTTNSIEDMIDDVFERYNLRPMSNLQWKDIKMSYPFRVFEINN
jgi:hypothetical protein